MFSGVARIASAGPVVAVSRGTVDLDAAQARQLTVHATPPPLLPPLGNVPAPPPPAPAYLVDGKLVSPQLALQGALPESYLQDTSDPAAELAIRREQAGSAALSFVPEPLGEEALETYFQHSSSRIATAQGGRLLLVQNRKRALLGAAEALERTWAIEGTGTTLRIDLAPACGGKATLALIRIEQRPGAEQALERFALSLKFTGVAPACLELE